MIASLPMYGWPELAPAHDRLWALIRDNLRAEGLEAPETLNRHMPAERTWEHPDLLLGQTCGLPYRTRLHGQVALVGTPDYGLSEAPAGHYYSLLVVRTDDAGRGLGDFAAGTLAFNSHDSQSGWAAIHAHAAERGIRFSRTLRCGTHEASARAVAAGRADIAAIDAITWRLIRRFRPRIAARLRILEHTAPTPGLPLITARPGAVPALFSAVSDAIARLAPAERDALGLRALVAIPAAAYLAQPTPPAPRHPATQT